MVSWQHTSLCHPTARGPQKGKRTLIVLRRVLTEPKTALAGVILESSLAISKVSMAIFNDEVAPSSPFDRWDLACIVETRGSRKKTPWRAGCEERFEA